MFTIFQGSEQTKYIKLEREIFQLPRENNIKYSAFANS